jgi:hypothetical protein
MRRLSLTMAMSWSTLPTRATSPMRRPAWAMALSSSTPPTVALACPAPGSLPAARPWHDYVIDGTMFFAGAVHSWSWTVTGGPCEDLFTSEALPPSFTLTGADTSQLTFNSTQVGDYTVHVTIVTAAGDTLDCTFVVHVAGTGLRVELCWDLSAVADIDLHVHRPHTTTAWFTANEDCYYLTCGNAADHVNSYVDWGYPKTPPDKCDALWTNINGECLNPRLEDDSTDPTFPEDMSIDLPEDGGTYRVMADYFIGGLGATFPIANIYCQGHLVASFGQAPDMVPGFDTDGYENGSMWRVADVTTHVDAAGITTCDVAALHPAGQTTG